MKIRRNRLFVFTLFLFFTLSSGQVNAQDDNPDPDEDLTTKLSGVKGFHFGFYLGAFFPGKATLPVYDGYGINLNGEKNDFYNSYMYRKIVIENGGSNGQPDRIAQILGVDEADPNAWTFSESDMPVDLRYKPAFMLGLHFNYGISKKGSILFNLNFARITSQGSFTIITPKPPQANQFYKTIHTYAIIGNEQRTSFQLGYDHIIGNHKYVNFCAEAGFSVNYAKVLKNFIQIEDLRLDLTSFDTQFGYNYTTPKEYTGWSMGVYGGLGLYLRLNSKFTAKVVYNPSYDRIKLGLNPEYDIQHAIGLRIYYNI